MKLEVFHDQALIQPLAAEEKVGSIIVPGTTNTDILYGKVLAVGPGILLEAGQYMKMPCSVGDKVLFDKRVSIETKVNGETVLLVRGMNILAKSIE